MRHGVHAALWMRSWSDDVGPWLDEAARIGFDGIEVSLLSGDPTTAAALRRRAASLGLELTCTTGLAPQHDVTSVDAATRAEGVRALERAIDTAHAMGSTLLSGVIYAPWGVRQSGDRGERWARAVDALRAVAPRAADLGVTLGIEAINRYETDLVTTADDARRMADDVGAVNVGVLLDTYHMNIEEKDVAAALSSVGERLVHLHVVENDRGVPGTGHVPWDAVTRALADLGYRGWATVEMFVQADLEVSPDLSIWRPIEPDASDAARRALAFLRERLR